jgi:hypothetical protein
MNKLKAGDLVRARMSSIYPDSPVWWVDAAQNKTPMLVMEVVNPEHYATTHVRLLFPDGEEGYAYVQDLTKRLW